MVDYFKMLIFTPGMDKIKPGYFAGGLIIGILIGFLLHSLRAGIAIGIVMGALLTFRKARKV